MRQSHEILKKHNLRITQFRINVIDVFLEAKQALSSSFIEQALDNTDRITLYRTLKSFEDKGIIHKAIDGTSTPKFALCESACTEHHHHDHHVHFHCQNCDSTFCLDHVATPKIGLPAEYKVIETNVIVNGVCSICNNVNKVFPN